MASTQARPLGDAAAAVVAAGVGALTLGLLTTSAEGSASIKDALNLYDPVGPLSGKTLGAVVVWLIAWGVLHMMWKGKDVPLQKWVRVGYVLLALGFLLTFPPFFLLFE